MTKRSRSTTPRRRLLRRDPLGPLTGGLRTAEWGEAELAEPRLVEALTRDSTNSRAWHALGVVRLKLGDLQGAKKAYSSGLSADRQRSKIG